jgi:hypothetical protein
MNQITPSNHKTSALRETSRAQVVYNTDVKGKVVVTR